MAFFPVMASLRNLSITVPSRTSSTGRYIPLSILAPAQRIRHWRGFGSMISHFVGWVCGGAGQSFAICHSPGSSERMMIDRILDRSARGLLLVLPVLAILLTNLSAAAQGLPG